MNNIPSLIEMNFYFLLLTVSTGALGAPFQSELDQLWYSYKGTFNKSYHALEEITRRYLWEKSLAFIQKHNIEADLKKHSFKVGINHLTDKLPEEYMSMNLLKVGNITKSRSISIFLAPENIEYPESVDWREKGLVTEVKNQGQCGSCWAFTAVGALEGQHMRKSGKLVSLSEQNLIDCATGGGNKGCKGGMIDAAFEYIQHNHGIDTEKSYPYKAKEGTCHFKKSDVGATLTGWVDIENYNEKMLLKAVATVGPIAVAINAYGYGFQEYKSGVYDTDDCDPEKLNHGVLAVGYGTEHGLDYWLIKNSWGTSWGENGYIKMRRNKNLCGIATIPSYPLV